MKCYNPKLAFVNPNGGRPIFTHLYWSSGVHAWNNYAHAKSGKIDGVETKALKMPCGKCEACRLEHARQRAVRCLHELKTHNGVGCFLTLTYRDLPEGGSFVEKDIVLFVKSLRKALGSRKIKTFGCAEYGDKSGRPHFHLLVFGFDFPDRYLWRPGSEHNSGHSTYRSPMLENLWKLGHSEIGSITIQSASYVARYTQKKCKSKASKEGLIPEKAVCISRRPGIGADFFHKYKDDFYSIDAVVIEGSKQGIPRYYDRLLEKEDPERFLQIKLDREEKRPNSEQDNTQERMKVRKDVHQQSLKRLRRSYEE